MLEGLKQEVRELTTVSGLEVQANEAAEMYLSRLQESLMTTNAINIRVHMGITEEIKRIMDVQAKSLGQEEYQRILDDDQADWANDYEDENVDICLTSDPTQGSDQEKIARANAMLEKGVGGLPIDLRKVTEDWLSAIGVDPGAYMPPKDDGKPDPFEQMQAQAMQTMSEAEAMKGQAALMKAQNEFMRVQIEQMKLQSEMDKLESETMKNLSEVDKNERSSVLEYSKRIDERRLQAEKLNEERLQNDRAEIREDRRERRESAGTGS
jgi:hypothetical protein